MDSEARRDHDLRYLVTSARGLCTCYLTAPAVRYLTGVRTIGLKKVLNTVVRAPCVRLGYLSGYTH